MTKIKKNFLPILILWTLSIAELFAGGSYADAAIRTYRSKGLDLRYAVTRPLGVNLKKPLPVWIYQQGDGDIDSPFFAVLAAGAAQVISQAYGVVFVWPEIRREFFYKDLKSYCALDFLHRVGDLNALIDTVKALPGVNNDRIFLIGHSAGAEVVTLTARRRDDLRAVVTLGGGVIQFADYLARTGEGNSIRGAETNACHDGELKRRGGQFWHEFFYSDLYNAIRDTRVPYLAVMGGRDQVSRVDVQLTDLARLKIEKPDFDFTVVAESGHSFANFKSWNTVNRWTKIH